MSLLRTIGFALLLLPALAQADDAKNRVRKELVGLYQIDLVCPAAPLIGCGSAAKPLLLELEHNANVSEAWLNRAGTIMAIVWKENDRRKRAKTLASVLENRKTVELKGKTRERVLREFISGVGWFHSAEVDRLSEEEAGIIAVRLVRRIGKEISLSPEKSKALAAGITGVMKRKLAGSGTESRSQIEEQILEICRQELNEAEIAVLKKARDEGAFAHLSTD